MDELKFYGKQHIFLFEVLKNKIELIDVLNELKNNQNVKNRVNDYLLKQFESYTNEEVHALFDNLINPSSDFESPTEFIGSKHKSGLAVSYCNEVIKNGVCLWNPEINDPVLVEVVKYGNDTEEVIRFKWVEKRVYGEEKENAERSVNFLIINLKNGIGELRIQSLKDYPEENIEKLKEKYNKIIKELIGPDLFSQIPMEPIIKSFIKEPPLEITGFHLQFREIKEPSYLKGKMSSLNYFKDELFKKYYFGKDIMVYWKCEQIVNKNERLYFKLDGRLGEVDFNSISDESKVDFILKQLLKYSEVKPTLYQLKRLNEKYPEYTRISAEIDYHFSMLNETTVNSKTIEDNTWFLKEQIEQVFFKAQVEYPNKFYVVRDSHGISLGQKVRFNLRSGGRDYIDKKTVDNRLRKTLAKAVVKVTALGLGAILLIKILDFLIGELFNITWEFVLPDLKWSFVYFIGLLAITFLYFGIDNITGLKRLRGEDARKVEFNKSYKEWIKRKKIFDEAKNKVVETILNI